MAINSRSSIQNINNRRFRIKENKCIIKFNKQSVIDKIYLYTKDPYEGKYLTNKREKVELDYFDDPKAFMEYSNDKQDFFKNIEDHNPKQKRKVLIVFNDMIADMINNKKLNSIITESFFRVENLKFLLFLLHNLILKCQNSKFQIKENFNKLF